MKNILLISLLIVIGLQLNAQSASGFSDTIKYYYCDLQCMEKGTLVNKGIYIVADFGGEQKFSSDTSYAKVLPLNGKPQVFTNTYMALNFMGSKGWKLVQYHTEIAAAGVELKHYILIKPH